ncbi:hypothetical protein MW887_004339 [Aspergillus wentii]|nr:hypothetical protein MW887_004339 [Aspergillus wentii]
MSSSTTSTSSRRRSIRNPLHNPLPASLSSECKKAGEILESFVNPQFFSLDVGIPRKVLAHAKGLAIFTSLRIGFLGSARFGSGLIVARLSDGSWSAPSAMATGGLGFGGQIGIELTDFVFVLNDEQSVRTFTQAGSVTLGGNVSLAAGPFGRTAEVGGALGKKGVAGMFAYSKTRGLFGGATIEGGMIGERPEANQKMYKRRVKVKELLSGAIPPPPEAEPLMSVLNKDTFRAESPSPPSMIRSQDIHDYMAELPAQKATDPPVGIPELDAGEDTQVHPQVTGLPAKNPLGNPEIPPVDDQVTPTQTSNK